MCPSAALAMGRHPTVPLVTITLSFYPLDGEGLPTTETTPEATLEDRRNTRCYLRQEAHASGSDADARRSRETTTLHRKRQAQVHALRSALPCPPTTDLGPDEIV